ncbi:hypothetical protein [uncultured Hymenobacter sp.]|uniref:hypothetical protein n=1 Tax=uncultured Hymenobacter sp. TaxID=170016 RepID=UPI0035CBCB58
MLDKHHYVHAYGVLIAQRWQDNYRIELYALDSFYCERWPEQESRHPLRYQAFATEACFALYDGRMPIFYQ